MHFLIFSSIVNKFTRDLASFEEPTSFRRLEKDLGVSSVTLRRNLRRVENVMNGLNIRPWFIDWGKNVVIPLELDVEVSFGGGTC